VQDKRSKDLTFIMVGHAHIDPVWLWDWREGYETVKATFRSALDRLRENPDMVFVHSSAAHYAWMENHPELLAEIREAVARGQWEPVGGWWVEPDANIPSGESLARQGLYGQRYFQKVLGRRAKVAFLADTFGHPHTLPQLFRQAGLESFLFMRPGASELDLPSNLFRWRSPDGSEVLAARVECYSTNPVYVQMSLARNLDWRPADARVWVHLFGVGNHGGGPTRKAIASIREANASPDWPTLRFGSLSSFFAAHAGRTDVPVHAGELQHHARGCYSAHSGIKAWNRQAESALLTAERWAVLASFYGLPYPADRLEHAWRLLLFNQFHDILAGTAIPDAYEDARRELGEAIAIADRTGYAALQVIAQRIDTRRGGRPATEIEPIRRVRWTPERWTVDLGDGTPVVVFNPSPWPRTEAVAVELNEWGTDDLKVLDDQERPVIHQLGRPDSVTANRPRVLFTAEVPAFGYRVYRVVDEPAAPVPEGGLTASREVLENRWWRLELDPTTGTLKALWDKSRGLQLLAGAGARLLVVADPSDTWGHGVTALRHEVGAFSCVRAELVEDGPVRATWRITYRWTGGLGLHSTARQEISLFRDSPVIEGRLTVDWHDRQRALKLAFPFALDEACATFSVPYGHAVRPADGQEEPLQQWLDVTGFVRDARGNRLRAGVALLNDGKYGGDVLGGEARLTLLRSPVYAHHDPHRLEEGVEYRYQDQGEQTTRWRLVPHAGSWADAGVVQAAHDLNTPMAVIREYAHPGELPKAASFVTVDPPDQVVVTALKQAEEGEDLILRLYEPAGRPARARVSIPLAQAAFAVEAGPYQIKSYRISRTGEVREVNILEE